MNDQPTSAHMSAVTERRDFLGESTLRVNAYLAIESVDGQPVMRCRCGAVLGPSGADYKSLSLEARYPIQHAGPFSNPYELGENRFELREYYCPACLVLFETDVAMRGDPNIRDVELARPLSPQP